MTALVLALMSGCTAEPTAPSDHGNIPFGEGTSGGAGAGNDDGNGGAPATPLVGEWERFEVALTPGDVITTTIHWRFGADASCTRVITTHSANEGFARTEVRHCTWSIGPASLTIRYSEGDEGTFDLAFPGFDANRLLLDGLEYQRIG